MSNSKFERFLNGGRLWVSFWTLWYDILFIIMSPVLLYEHISDKIEDSYGMDDDTKRYL